LRQGWGVNRRRGQKSQFQHGGKGFRIKKVRISSLEMSVVKKSISAWLDWAKKRKKKSKKFSKNCQKVVKHFVKPSKN
jgi:hypothetical protein